MFKIKICGVTRTEDLPAIAAAGADAVGINLVPSSPRCVSLDQASALSAAAHALGLSVFVVVMDPEPSQLQSIVDRVAPDAIQLHGQETVDLVASLGRCAIVKALSWTGRAEESAAARAWAAEAARRPLAFLVDAYAPGVGGGTGRVARWDLLQPRPAELAGVPMLLAGGLKADNVAEAIAQTGCEGVDTASGVESSPGIKQKELVEAFVRAARQAFDGRQQAAAAS